MNYFLDNIQITDQIKWHIVRGTPDLSLILSPGETIHRMSALPIKQSDNADSRIAVNKVIMNWYYESLYTFAILDILKSS